MSSSTQASLSLPANRHPVWRWLGVREEVYPDILAWIEELSGLEAR